MKYQIIRYECDREVVLMQCDFEDKKHFRMVAQNSQYRILRDGKDVTGRYKKG